EADHRQTGNQGHNANEKIKFHTRTDKLTLRGSPRDISSCLNRRAVDSEEGQAATPCGCCRNPGFQPRGIPPPSPSKLDRRELSTVGQILSTAFLVLDHPVVVSAKTIFYAGTATR